MRMTLKRDDSVGEWLVSDLPLITYTDEQLKALRDIFADNGCEDLAAQISEALKPKPNMATVRDLIERLSRAPSLDMPVLMDDGNGWYCYVADIELPLLDEKGGVRFDDGVQLPTVMPGLPFDSRDL